MEKKVKKTGLARIPAWALSLIILFVTIAVEIILNDPKNTSFSTIQILGSIFNIILVTVACFIICRTHPKSIWYTLLICNGVLVLGFFANIFLTIAFTIAGKDYGISLTEWIIMVSSLVLSVTGAIIGAKIGRRRIDQAK